MRGTRTNRIRGVKDIKTMSGMSARRLSPQAAFMKIASLELEKKILEFVKRSSVGRMEGIKGLVDQIDQQVEKIGAQESALAKITAGQKPIPAAAGPDSCKEVFEQMPGRLKKEATVGFNAVYQFNLNGNGGGKWQVKIQDNRCEVSQGENPSPNITISMDAQDFLGLISGTLNPQSAFMSGKVKIDGDMSLATKLGELFDTSSPAPKPTAAPRATRSVKPPAQTDSAAEAADAKPPGGVPALKYGRE